MDDVIIMRALHVPAVVIWIGGVAIGNTVKPDAASGVS